MDPSPNASPSRSPELPVDPRLAEGWRSALEPEEASVARVVRAALAELPARNAPAPEAIRPLRLVATLAATTALAASLILALPGWRAPEPASPSGRITIFNQGEVVYARRGDESAGWIVRSGATGASPSSQIILVFHGD